MRRTTTRPRMSEAELKAIVDELADIACVLDDADPADKAEIFRRLGLKLTYHQANGSSKPPSNPRSMDSPRGT
jgi:site-specific DNA recombinase